DELQRLSREDVPAAEVAKAKNQLEADFVMAQASSEELALRLGEAEALTGVSYLDHYVENIHRVTPQEMRHAVATYLVPPRSTVGVLTPRAGSRPESGDGGRGTGDGGPGTGSGR